MDRRQFLKGIGVRAAFVGLVVVAAGSLPKITSSQIARHLRSAYWYLQVDDADLQQFAREYHEIYGAPTLGHLQHVEDIFLRSTDFFPNGADESRPVRFVALYEPYASPCFNPLRSP